MEFNEMQDFKLKLIGLRTQFSSKYTLGLFHYFRHIKCTLSKNLNYGPKGLPDVCNWLK